ncbi:MAG: PIG-L family deacetylase, partial [Actinomycetia bacterium]|nr:PIG-L family deacetylase [Actinomycetes bacterium]
MKVLAIGAHPDDIELGCGGTLLAHRRRGDEVSLLVMSTGERGPRDSLPRTIEQERAADVLGAELHWGGFEDCAVPPGRETIDVIENVLLWAGADVVYSHTPNDSHQDHRAVATATLAAGRRIPRICLYEAPTTTEFSPAVYVDVDGLVEDKLELLRAHESQVLKNGLVDLEAIQ